MAKIINRVGQTFNNLIITQELGNKKVMARCLICNSEKEYYKSHITSGNQKSCGCINGRFIDRTGEKFNGIKVIAELGASKILGQCIHCESVREYNKRSVTEGNCRSCGCIAKGKAIIDRTDETFNNLKIVKELGNSKVTCKCLVCNSIRDYNKSDVVASRINSCGCTRVISPIRDKTGQTFRGLQVIKEIGEGKVYCKCVKCKHEDTYDKVWVVREKALCKKCGNKIRTDETDHIYGKLQVIRELGGSKVTCRCIKCGYEDTYDKRNVTQQKTNCRKCRTGIRKNITGEIFRDLQIIKENGGHVVKCKCLKCGHVDDYNKPEVIISSALCKNCGKRIKDRTGEVYKGLKIIREIGGKRVICNCIECGHSEEYDKMNIVRGEVRCKHCKPKSADILNEIFNDLKILKDLGNRNVICQCIYCGHTAEYSKYSVVNTNVRCKYCSLIINYKEKVINAITVTDKAYTGRDGNNYFNCTCNKCGEVLTLTREELVKYTCNKG